MSADKLPTRKIPSICNECGASYDKTEFLVCEVWQWGSAICPACEAKDEAARVEKTASPLWLQRFEEVCPPDFCSIALGELPDRAAFYRAMKWNTKLGTSLLLVGPTGAGKSRTLYAKLREIVLANPAIEIAKFDAISFGETSKAKSYIGRGAEWSAYLRRVDLVVFDDLFRGNLNGGVQEELFALISARTEERLPMMATTQFTEKTLDQVMQAHHVAAICRRFRDYFTVVPFKKTQTKNEE